MNDQLMTSIPSNTYKAIKLLYCSLGVMVSVVILSLRQQEAMIPYLIGSLIPLSLCFVFIMQIGKKKNWARITLLIFLIITIPIKGMGFLTTLSIDLIGGILSLTVLIIQVIATILLFSKSSSVWFKS